MSAQPSVYICRLFPIRNGLVLTDDQLATVARVAGEVCRGRALTIMHVGAIRTASAAKGAAAAKKYGCDAVC